MVQPGIVFHEAGQITEGRHSDHRRAERLQPVAGWCCLHRLEGMSRGFPTNTTNLRSVPRNEATAGPERHLEGFERDRAALF